MVVNERFHEGEESALGAEYIRSWIPDVALNEMQHIPAKGIPADNARRLMWNLLEARHRLRTLEAQTLTAAVVLPFGHP